MNDPTYHVQQEKELVELLAEKEHESWSNWMKWIFQLCPKTSDGSVFIRPDLVKRWERQSATVYHDLTEEEKQSDRDEVQKIVDIIIDFKLTHIEDKVITADDTILNETQMKALYNHSLIKYRDRHIGASTLWLKWRLEEVEKDTKATTSLMPMYIEEMRRYQEDKIYGEAELQVIQELIREKEKNG